MVNMTNIFTIILVIASLAIIFAVMVQDSKSQGIASLTGETNLGGTGGKMTKDHYINRVVVVSAVVFIVAAIALAIVH